MRLMSNTLAYNDEGVIAGTLRCLEPFVDRRVVLISEKPYFGKPQLSDRTEEIAESLGAEVIKGIWSLDNFQRNLGVQMCQDCDWIITFDSDEMMTKDEFEQFIFFLEKTSLPAVAVCPEVYWKTTDYRLDPRPEYTPIIAVRPTVNFTHIRNIDSPHVLYDGSMHHLSWCAPKDIYKKVTHYAHAPEFKGHAWYRENYENWTFGNPAKLPTGTFNVVENHLPEELQKYLEAPIGV